MPPPKKKRKVVQIIGLNVGEPDYFDQLHLLYDDGTVFYQFMPGANKPWEWKQLDLPDEMAAAEAARQARVKKAEAERAKNTGAPASVDDVFGDDVESAV